MRRTVWIAVGLGLAAMLSWGAAPASAMAIPAPAALKPAGDTVKLTETVGCGYYGCRPYRAYRPYYRPYRPYYRSYYRPYYRSYYRPYARPYRQSYSRPYYRPYSYRPAYRSYWNGYGHRPARYFYVGPNVYRF